MANNQNGNNFIEVGSKEGETTAKPPQPPSGGVGKPRTNGNAQT